MTEKPKPKSVEAAQEIKKVEEQLNAAAKNIQEMTLDKMNAAPKEDVEPQTKIAQKDLEKSNDIYLKPTRSISSKEKFDEKWREDYNFQKEFVRFIPEHKELIGENIEMWTKPFPGMPAEFWTIPTGKPIWGPRYVAERCKGCSYHRLVMKQNIVTEANSLGQMFGALAADTIIQRIDAVPVSTRKSIFMGASSF